jgi:hypothetical protein
MRVYFGVSQMNILKSGSFLFVSVISVQLDWNLDSPVRSAVSFRPVHSFSVDLSI